MQLRPATEHDAAPIWAILRDAIERRRLDGSDQWQNGYPNEEVVASDIQLGYGHVLVEGDAVLAYAALMLDGDPAYPAIEGRWLTEGPYLVVHRVATSAQVLGKGLATRLFEELEPWCRSRQIFSIKVDTNFDNAAMLRVLEKLGYTYCGEVIMHGSPRKAFEKVL